MQGSIFSIQPSTQNQGNPSFTAGGWCQITVLKESSGIVVMGTGNNLLPVNTAQAMQLPTDQPITFLIGPGTSIYFAAQTTERVSYIVQPIPESMIRSVGGNLPGASQQSTGPYGGLGGGRCY